MTDHAEGKLSGAGDRKLYWQSWIGSDSSKGVIVLVHGLHEHSGRYEWVATRLADAGYAVYALDHAGHGRSDGARGQIGRMPEVVAGVDALVTLAAGRHPGPAPFIVAHSMGSLITLDYLVGNPQELRGIVLSAPPLVQDVASPLLLKVAKVLSVVAPNAPTVELDSETVSRDPAIVEYHRTNPLMVKGKIRARTGAEFIGAVDRVTAGLAKVTQPIFVIAGSADKLVKSEGANLVVEGAGSTDKTLKIYDGLYHEVFNEPEKETVIADVIAWLDERN
jgi:acylglycerol lipase